MDFSVNIKYLIKYEDLLTFKSFSDLRFSIFLFEI